MSLDLYAEIVETDRLESDAAEFRFGGSTLLAKPNSDADFLADAGIVDDGLEPRSR